MHSINFISDVTQFSYPSPFIFHLTILYQFCQGKTKKNVDQTAERLFVGGLNPKTEDITLRNYFSMFGEIADFNILRQSRTRHSRTPKCYGFITFKNDGSLKEAIGTQPHYIDGIAVKLEVSSAQRPKVPQVLVSNLDTNVNANILIEMFSAYGEVLNTLDILQWKFCKGHCPIVYRTWEECDLAIKGLKDERLLTVSYTRENRGSEDDKKLVVRGMPPNSLVTELLSR